jgi:hypothetical protein
MKASVRLQRELTMITKKPPPLIRVSASKGQG